MSGYAAGPDTAAEEALRSTLVGPVQARTISRAPRLLATRA